MSTVGTSTDDPFDWEDDSHFDETWLEDIRIHQSQFISSSTVTSADVRPWFKYIKNPYEPEQSRYTCRICSEHFQNLGLVMSVAPELSKPQGFFQQNKQLNTNKIRNHLKKSGAHYKVLDKLLEKKKAELEKELEVILNDAPKHNEDEYKITCRMIRLIYFEAKSNIAFNKVRTILDFFQ